MKKHVMVRMWGKLNSHALLVGMLIGAASVKKLFRVSKKTEK